LFLNFSDKTNGLVGVQTREISTGPHRQARKQARSEWVS
jgi:hypothetical protein